MLRRSVRRSATRTELWAGNRERLRTLFGRDELLRFAWRAFPKYRRRYRALAGDPAGAHLTWIVLRTPREVRDWLASV